MLVGVGQRADTGEWQLDDRPCAGPGGGRFCGELMSARDLQTMVESSTIPGRAFNAFLSRSVSIANWCTR